MKALSILFLLAGAVMTETMSVEPARVLVSDSRPALPHVDGIKPVTTCGDIDESQDVETYRGDLGVGKAYVAKHEPSTVQLQWATREQMEAKWPGYTYGNVAGRRWCSGTLISATQVLTAGHCFDIQHGQDGWLSPYKGNPPVHLAPAELAKLQVVNFVYQVNGATGAKRPGDTYPITGLIEHRNGGLDYAIVEIGANSSGVAPATKYAPASVVISLMSGKPLVAIIQHPDGQPKKIEAGTVLQVQGDSVFYDDVDTQGGSSGSGVRNAQGSVVGVHTNGGCTKTGGANRGVTSAAISRVSNVF